MAERPPPTTKPSLRRRFATWFGLLFVVGAVALRVLHYQGTVDVLVRDVDVQLWSRLAAVKAQERFAPDTLLHVHARTANTLLPDVPASPARRPRPLFEFIFPAIDAWTTGWFAGVWHDDGTLVDDLDLPPGLAWDARWRDRLDTIWTTPDGRFRLAATAGAHQTTLVVGTPLAGLASAERRAALFQVATFFLWVPLLLGIAWFLFARLLEPLGRITDMARRIRAGTFDERVDVSRTDAEFHEMAGALNEMLDRLDAIRQSQARFNADVAHQLLNPVHAILLETEAAPRRSAEQAAEALARIEGLARRIGAICDVLLTYSRTGGLDPARLRPIDLEPVVAAAIDRVAARAKDRGIAIDPPPVGVVVRGDAALVEEVFVNLLANAVEHSSASGRIEIVASGDGAGRRIAIVDHGAGVAAADMPFLFERFHSGKPEGGHGIGLALSRRILLSHGGDLAHAATPGGGATFTLRFPAATSGS